MLTRKDNVKVGDRVVAELDTKEGLFATSFFVSKVHSDGTLTVTAEKCFRNGAEERASILRTFRAHLDAFDHKASA